MYQDKKTINHLPNKKINLTGTAMCASERAVLRRALLKIPMSCAPHVPAGYF